MTFAPGLKNRANFSAAARASGMEEAHHISQKRLKNPKLASFEIRRTRTFLNRMNLPIALSYNLQVGPIVLLSLLRPKTMRTIFSQSFLMLASATALSASSTVPRRKVVVSGAGGQTGQFLFRKMLALPDEFDAIGLVRSEESKKALIESGDVPESSVKVVDVTDADAVKQVAKDCSAFCICTSAKPKPTGETDETTGRPIFGFPNGIPEEVDWQGQKNQIDACGPEGHVLICSSMGGTDPNHVLNVLGRTINPDGTASGGNILKWKRKAEVHLMESGKTYTIVHPGGLINESGGERELVLGVDDSTEGTDSRTVPREDVAEVMLQALKHPDLYGNRSFDLRAKPSEEGSPTTDFRALVESLNGKNCDYSLGEIL